MRKVFINKWFFLAAAFTISLSTVSFIAYKKTQSVSSTDCCQKNPASVNQKADMLWDILSRKLTNFISIQ